MHFYNFNIGDYRRRTNHLTPLEHGVYRTLLDTYYLEEKALTPDMNKLMRTHSIRSPEEKQALVHILDDFFVLDEYGFVNKACDEVIARYQEKSMKAKASADARWHPKKDGKMRTHSEGNANQEPITNNQEPRTNKPVAKKKGSKVIPSVRFAEFWKVYDKKINLKKCEGLFNKLSTKKIDALFLTLSDYVKSTPDKQYRMHPLTYLNGERWNDEIKLDTAVQTATAPKPKTAEEKKVDADKEWKDRGFKSRKAMKDYDHKKAMAHLANLGAKK